MQNMPVTDLPGKGKAFGSPRDNFFGEEPAEMETQDLRPVKAMGS